MGNARFDMVLAPEVKSQQQTIAELDREWTYHLTTDEFAMAPTEEKRAGRVTTENYALENKRFAEFERSYVENVYSIIRPSERTFRKKAIICGIGHKHTLPTVIPIIEAGDKPEFWDVSTATVTQTYQPLFDLVENLKRQGCDTGNFPPSELAKQGEIRSAIETGEIGENVRAVIASRYEQHNNIAMLEALGSLLSEPDRFLVLIHLFPNWNGQHRRTRSSKPYANPIILKALQKGAGRKIVRQWPACCRYYGQIYTAATYMAA